MRQSRRFVQEPPPGVVVVSAFVAGINLRGCRGCHLDCQAILAKSTPSDTTPLGSSRYWCVFMAVRGKAGGESFFLSFFVLFEQFFSTIPHLSPFAPSL